MFVTNDTRKKEGKRERKTIEREKEEEEQKKTLLSLLDACTVRQ